MRNPLLFLLLLTVTSLSAGESNAVKVSDTTVQACVLSQPACKPGFGVKIKYRWDAKPLDRDYGAFVHIENTNGKFAFQDDHATSVATSKWSGQIEYENLVVVPLDAPPGDYKIKLGLWHPKTGKRAVFKAGEGVTELVGSEYLVGILKVDPNAPVPPLPAPTLNLDGYHVTFDEDFNDKELSVSAHGPGTRWTTHTPYNGDFGDAGFADPEKDFPFTVENGVLRIEARKTGKRWRGGLLCSVDSKGEGFSQKYGYFEMRAKLPSGAGTWPAFWLDGVPALKDKTVTNIEIDVFEIYGVNPNVLHATVHLWHPGGKHEGEGKHFITPGTTEDFHKYGVMVTEEKITFYFDGIELCQMKTPEEAKVPLYIMADLTLGGGWPINKTPNPSYMYIDYIRAYSK